MKIGMILLVMEYCVSQGREGPTVMILILPPHVSLKMRIVEMVFEKGVKSLEMVIEKNIGMMETIFKMAIIIAAIQEVV